MDDERLEKPKNIFRKDYFEQQLARNQDIRIMDRHFLSKNYRTVN